MKVAGYLLVSKAHLHKQHWLGMMKVRLKK